MWLLKVQETDFDNQGDSYVLGSDWEVPALAEEENDVEKYLAASAINAF